MSIAAYSEQIVIITCAESMIREFRIIGSDKHRIAVTGVDYTVGQLQQTLTDITQVPVTAQKIIFKGINDYN